MKPKKCTYGKCKNNRRSNGSGGFGLFCKIHSVKVNPTSFLSALYTTIARRTRGDATKRPDLYRGLPIMPKEVFMSWAKNHPDFLRLYKQWVTADFDRRLTPSLNRMNSSRGYTLDNVNWLTNSQNSGLSGSVRQAKNRKAVYELLGVK